MTSALERWLYAGLATARGRAAAALALFVLTAAGLCLRLGDAPVVRNPERRIDAGVRHMLASGDWLVPHMDGAPRLQKPPLYTWTAAAGSALAGAPSRFALRLPSALAALGLLGVVFAWGRSLAGFACGWLAAAFLVQMAQFWSLGRRGVAEMLLVCFATLALYAFDRVHFLGRARWRPVFYLALWLALLAKATTALLLVGVPVLIELGLERRLVDALRRAWPWLLCCAAGALAWWGVVLVRVPGAWPMLREALLLPFGLTDSIGSAAHVKPLWFYLPQLLAVSAPAVALAPLVIQRAGGRRAFAADPRTRFVARAALAIAIGFSALPMKQKHYLLPLLPLSALLLGRAAVLLAAERRAWLVGFVARLAPLALGACALAGLLLALHLRIAADGPAWLAPLCAFALLALGALVFAAARRGALAVSAACALAASLLFFTGFSASFAVWRDRFQAQPSAESEVAVRWQPLFARYPWLRPVYGAGHVGIGEPRDAPALRDAGRPAGISQPDSLRRRVAATPTASWPVAGCVGAALE